jgi:hypothetical protein
MKLDLKTDMKPLPITSLLMIPLAASCVCQERRSPNVGIDCHGQLKSLVGLTIPL